MVRGTNLNDDRSDGARLLAEAVRTARNSYGYSQDDIAERGGPSRDRMWAIENATLDRYDTKLLRRLENALWWRAGSIESIIRGGAPILREDRPRIGESTPQQETEPEELATGFVNFKDLTEESATQLLHAIGTVLGRDNFLRLAHRVYDALGAET